MAPTHDTDTTPRDRAAHRFSGAADSALATASAEVLDALSDIVEASLWLRSVPRELTLSEVLAGAERAEQRVAAWPEWKRRVA